jgi:hypothetical protein
MERNCDIPEPELRGITIHQLRNVCQEIKLRCVEEKWERSFDGIRTCLQPDEVNLYDLNINFIIPQTTDSKCSYIELVASGPQPPQWFVSHWWGEPVFDFVACIEKHAFDRNLDENTSYWVCAYANNQHNLGNEVGGSDLTQSSFYRALKLTKGVLSIVDRNSVVFSRVWCSFEISIALEKRAGKHDQGHEEEKVEQEKKENSIFQKQNKPRYLYDVYTHSNSGETVGLTDGVVAADMYPRNKDGTLNTQAFTYKSNYNGMRTIRQANFPSKLCEKGLTINLETAEASVDIDRRRILNFISGNKTTDGEPPTAHESYDYINKLLRSKFAIAAYRRCLEEGKDVKKIRNALSEAPIDNLQLSFHGTRQFKEEASLFTKSLPTSLKRIDLKFTMQLFETSAEFAKGFRRLNHLESFKLDCSTCTLTSCTDLWGEIENLENLQVLDLNFSYNQYMQSIEGLGKAISNLSNLEELKLNFSECSCVRSIEELLSGLLLLNSNSNKVGASSLKLLSLNFSSSGLSEKGIERFFNTLITANFEVEKLYLNFDPVIDLHSVRNMYSLKKRLRGHNSCCDNCIII